MSVAYDIIFGLAIIIVVFDGKIVWDEHRRQVKRRRLELVRDRQAAELGRFTEPRMDAGLYARLKRDWPNYHVVSLHVGHRLNRLRREVEEELESKTARAVRHRKRTKL